MPSRTGCARLFHLMERQPSFPILKAVIFDMDGVLCDSEPFLYEAAKEMFSTKYRVEVSQSDFLPFVGTGEDRYLGGVAETYGIELDMPSDKEYTYDIYLRVITGRLKPLAGAREFVDECRRSRLQLAVATSADRIKMEGNLRQIGLPPELFDVCITGSEVEHKKPDPSIFLTAARALRCPSRNCLVVEDAPVGVVAAGKAGSPCLGISSSFPTSELASAGADWVAPDLTCIPMDLRDLLHRHSEDGEEKHT